MKKWIAGWMALCLTAASLPVTAFAADETLIHLSDSIITVDGEEISTDSSEAVYIGADIIYYQSGMDSSYGEGTSADAHSSSVAEEHKVVTITQPGIYRLSGTLTKGQVAVDLGSGAAEDPNAVVTLILDGVNITCEVAPAIIFYNVYECCEANVETAGNYVDTADAGANVIIADDSMNYVNGSYVAKIYKEGTTKKLHKYDGALYSKMSMNVDGQTKSNGELHITAENEGLDSELHLTINGGRIYIIAQDDGINTNEDDISVTTINGGYLFIQAGLGSEGDGIDSNGYLTINGGEIVTYSVNTAADGGIDADKDIVINGGTLIAFGGRNDTVSESNSAQAYMELRFASNQKAGSPVQIVDSASGDILFFISPLYGYQSLTVSSADLKEGETYSIFAGGEINGVVNGDGIVNSNAGYTGGTLQQYTGNNTGGFGGGMGGQRPSDNGGNREERGEIPGESRQLPAGRTNGAGVQGMDWSQGEEPPADMPGAERQLPGFELPDGEELSREISGVSEKQESSDRNDFGGQERDTNSTQGSVQFTLSSGSYSFSGVSDALSGTADTTSVSDTGTLPFSDVNRQSGNYEGIQFVYEKGLMVGTSDTEFSPDTTVTRAMAVTVLGRLEGAQPSQSSAYRDVEISSWYSGYIDWAADNGLVTGYGDGLFGPEDVVSREQICQMIYSYAGLKGITLTSAEADFSDRSDVSDWAETAVSACYGTGLLDFMVSGNRLNPAQELTRGELSQIIYKLSQL